MFNAYAQIKTETKISQVRVQMKDGFEQNQCAVLKEIILVD